MSLTNIPTSTDSNVQASLLDAETPFAEGEPDRKSLLIIDDNVDAADSLGICLECVGYKVVKAHTGRSGLVIARSFKPTTVIIDIGLPDINGFEIARELREGETVRLATLIALTGWSRPEYEAMATNAGFDHYIVKPAMPDTIQDLLAAREKIVVDSELAKKLASA